MQPNAPINPVHKTLTREQARINAENAMAEQLSMANTRRYLLSSVSHEAMSTPLASANYLRNVHGLEAA